MTVDPETLSRLVEEALREAMGLAQSGGAALPNAAPTAPTAAPSTRSPASPPATPLAAPSPADRRPPEIEPRPGLARWLRDLDLPEAARIPPPFRRPAPPLAAPAGPERPVGISRPKDPAALQTLLRASPARLGVGRAGVRCRTATVLQFLADHAVALDAVASLLPADFAARHALVEVRSRVSDHAEYLLRPDLGRLLDDGAAAALSRCDRAADVQVIVGDGLSAAAVELQWPRLAGPLQAALSEVGLRTGTPVLARFARVMLQDRVCEATAARSCVLIVGERPGLGGGDGVSAYMVYQPRAGTTDADKNMIPNICDWGTPPAAAVRQIARTMRAMFDQGLSGTLLKLD